jgi:inner membrane protein
MLQNTTGMLHMTTASSLCQSNIFRSPKRSLKFLILSIVCTVIPDADVVGYLWLYIPAHSFCGHRDFFHFPFFEMACNCFCFLSKRNDLFKTVVEIFHLFFYSHCKPWDLGCLDQWRPGYRSVVAFFPWTPLEVSPIGVKAFMSQRGLTVLTNELLWNWVPSFFTVICLKTIRNMQRIN